MANDDLTKSFLLLNAQTQGAVNIQPSQEGHTLVLKSIGISTLYLTPVPEGVSQLGLNTSLQMTRYNASNSWYITGGTSFDRLGTDYLSLTSTPFTISSGFITLSVNQVYLDFSTITLSTQELFLSSFATSTATVGQFTLPEGISVGQLYISSATFSTISTTTGEVSISSSWYLNNSLPITALSTTPVFTPSYTVSSITALSTNAGTLIAPHTLQTQPITFTAPNQFVTLSSLTQAAFVDTSSYSGKLLLPPVSSVRGAVFYIQDIGSNFQLHPLTLSTTGIDTFFPQTTNLCNLTSQSITLIAAEGNTYRTVQETLQTSTWFNPEDAQTSTLQTGVLRTVQITAPTSAQTQTFVFS